MDVRNCRGCGKLFNYVSGPFMCPACREKLEEKFQEVKKYIQENKGVTVSAVAEACDIDSNQIRQWIREERLEFASGASEICCEKCGTPITSGRFCDKCKNSMVNSLNNVYAQEAPAKPERNDKSDGGPKMRFLS
ncbi:MAG: flagellar protein [Lachnospiraceae bacterium]|nr:flagellar protein [Lachnospiraceae bacterium]